MRVSILIPCRNAAPWLRECLDSAFAQTWPDKEVILVDDGSTDGSADIAATYSSRGLQIVRGPARNAAAARNAALERCTGQWIQFLDADDLLAPDKIALQLDRARKDPTLRLFSAEWARFTRDPAEARFSPQPHWRDLDGREFLRLHFLEGWMMQPAAWLVRRDLAVEAGPWNEALTLNDDGEYFARVMLAAPRIAFCTGARVYYRTANPSSLSRRKDPAALESYFRSLELCFETLDRLTDPETARPIKAAGWKWGAFELYPGHPVLSREAEHRCRLLGGSPRPYPAGGKFQAARRLLGWRLAKRLFCS